MIDYLVVIRPFLNFVRGDVIADVGKIGEIMAAEYKRFVIKIVAPKS
jgi:hypothetical protein